MATQQPVNINNLNVFTFIREIYHSLKHLDIQINGMNQQMNERLSKIEENQQILKTRFDNIELLLQKVIERGEQTIGLNKGIESQLLNKMNMLNRQNAATAKVELKPNEMTFENIIENEYTFGDIGMQSVKYIPFTDDTDLEDFNKFIDARTTDTKQKKEQDINSLLF